VDDHHFLLLGDIMSLFKDHDLPSLRELLARLKQVIDLTLNNNDNDDITKVVGKA
jgi:hypothetical protein